MSPESEISEPLPTGAADESTAVADERLIAPIYVLAAAPCFVFLSLMAISPHSFFLECAIYLAVTVVEVPLTAVFLGVASRLTDGAFGDWKSGIVKIMALRAAFDAIVMFGIAAGEPNIFAVAGLITAWYLLVRWFRLNAKRCIATFLILIVISVISKGAVVTITGLAFGPQVFQEEAPEELPEPG